MKLTPTDTAKRISTPPLQGRGRGWGLSAERLAQLHSRAREMRNNPTEPEMRLWGVLSGKQLQGAKFRRQAVIPPFIVDFFCPTLKLIVEVDGDTHDQANDESRDELLTAKGYMTLRFSNEDVMQNMDGVWCAISDVLSAADNPHPNPSPEGEGLERLIGDAI